MKSTTIKRRAAASGAATASLGFALLGTLVISNAGVRPLTFPKPAQQAHYATTGVDLPQWAIARVEHIVHHLPTCQSRQVSNCRVHIGHRRTLASFRTAHLTFFVRMHKGQLVGAEVYR